ncbi:hypothetical protein DSM100688_0889 [Bifidobacterium ramosum]|uniref:Uncharacterized protein n=1 Tax=Bifidobacterium ramosum TaxID=1798158 RepID=A0A6L4X168_9BIFI|nr:hypothetical protein DSM100688_0889 [Bifidobacterium ramosum]
MSKTLYRALLRLTVPEEFADHDERRDDTAINE